MEGVYLEAVWSPMGALGWGCSGRGVFRGCVGPGRARSIRVTVSSSRVLMSLGTGTQDMARWEVASRSWSRALGYVHKPGLHLGASEAMQGYFMGVS